VPHVQAQILCPILPRPGFNRTHQCTAETLTLMRSLHRN
jgi:hypothetical protein